MIIQVIMFAARFKTDADNPGQGAVAKLLCT